MGWHALKAWAVTALGIWGGPTLTAQEHSLLRDLPAVDVIIDRVHVPLVLTSEDGADSLRGKVIQSLRTAGMLVSDQKVFTTLGNLMFAPQSSFERPTFLVSLNMVPDGCAFVVNFFLAHDEKVWVSEGEGVKQSI